MAAERPARRPAARDRGEGSENSGERRDSRAPRVAPEFADIPTWEEAIGALSLRTPTEDHARRTESRGRGGRDGGGSRPPRRR